MIPLPFIIQILQAAFALACVVGYRMLDSNPRRGHLLIGIGSAGLVVLAPNEVYMGLSLYWVWAAAIAHERARKNAAG